ncbi:MAG TPA: zinc ribbon domain-containing protein [Phycisphaerae bacterium]|nr:zinc ribbon domain-containing protein [Phycisphaerae bacterium]HOJ73311.1 zinc ribbon domain-containing protein [Phycisphaerae bacterium]HOM51123.1 zinc ribbon domain-containing protein [Phycisphaerae bacterium]HON66080.1 zinc ribbon domain-containing protein [Phycisphaerae bacterium]HOQ86065.1 zinc ribbon domain-containing protein [Phycisphaerae bacterium]
MPERTPINPDHESTRNVFRVAGPLVFGLGGLFMIIGFVDFASGFGGTKPPTMFWCFFVGMPLLGIGATMTRAGYAGKIARYYSQEITPVATDTFKYAARETKDSIREIAGAIREGLVSGTSESARVEPMPGTAPATPPPLTVRILRCHRCNHDNTAEARFCSQCGVALAKQVPCRHCDELNDPDAKFCDNCGKPIA